MSNVTPLQIATVAGLLWLVLINMIAFRAFAEDKQRAVYGLSRIPEANLLGLVSLGGGGGALAAMQLFRHKTCKQPFRTNLQLILAAQAIGAACVAVWFLYP